jgi:hypothetical protein
MAGRNIKEEPVQVLPANIDVGAYLALRHEVTEQFPAEPTAPSKKVEPRQVQQLPPGVKAEDYLALLGEQPG